MEEHQVQKIYLGDLANEILLHIFQSLHSVRDCLALAATSRHFRSLLASSHRLPILFEAAESQFGPLRDAIRLVTHNASQAAHIVRQPPPQSLPLLRQIIEVGRVANKWAAIYPIQRWRQEESSDRRLLSEWEQYRLRRACYRIWLYSMAFHTPAFPRTTRLSPPNVRARAALLRAWNSRQLAEMLDLLLIFKQTLSSVICPSNVTVERRHKARHPYDPFPLVAVTQPEKWAREHALYHHRTHFHSTPHRWNLLSPGKNVNGYGMALEGWGDEISHYYVLEDMLKLDPGQLMYLYEQITDVMGTTANFHAGWSSKGMVESFVAGIGGTWFENNGETLAETIAFVEDERGGNGLELRDAVADGVAGLTMAIRDDYVVCA